MSHTMTRAKKRLFLALLLVSLFLALVAAYGVWRVSLPGLANISQYLPLLLGGIGILAAVAALLGIGGMILALLGVPTLPVFQSVAWTVANWLFPLAVRIGRLFDIEKERVERSFIELSNQLVRLRRITVPADRLLILTPHCLQLESCPHKITRQIFNCKECGGCPVGGLVALAKKYGVHVAVVTGGTLARQVVKGLRPKAILAIACERDLTSGIQDVFPLPVIGVLNDRPFGPCFNTQVDMERVERTVRVMIGLPEDMNDDENR